ncbi:hypothetical protein DAEQUDRAFT_205612 [Daedalea quercina L-15889]|uniref:F-box domain-containing protein n=1 Tax=Daedalea quercina L-15889 TaxID=1314783 RepID=A0A165R879_9APHY|nr:hypothetical protein DAEQUDRAFT_205612 [Daedalea quercina L-15889]
MMHPLTGAFEFASSSENLPDGQMTHRKPFSVPRLPPELWEQVIDHLQDDHPSLRECSLTCRTWVPATRYHLFDRIDFSSQHDILRFRDTLDLSELAATDIARYVRCVAIVGLPLCRLSNQYDDGNALLLHDILIRLPNTDTLMLDNVDIDVHLPLDYTDTGGELRPFSHLFPLPDLRVLRLSSVMFHSIHDVARLIAAFTGLSAIGIDRALWWQDNSGSSPLWDEERQGSHHTLRNLTRLSLFAVPSPVDLLRRIQRFPSLQSTRHFGWTTYVADEKRLLLWLLHNSTSNVKNMDLVTRYDNECRSSISRCI